MTRAFAAAKYTLVDRKTCLRGAGIAAAAGLILIGASGAARAQCAPTHHASSGGGVHSATTSSGVHSSSTPTAASPSCAAGGGTASHIQFPSLHAAALGLGAGRVGGAVSHHAHATGNADRTGGGKKVKPQG